MDPWETAVYTGVIVIAGSVTQPNHRNPIELLGAAVFYALFLIGLQSIDQKLAQAFAYLVLIAAVLEYGTNIIKSLGVTH